MSHLALASTPNIIVSEKSALVTIRRRASASLLDNSPIPPTSPHQESDRYDGGCPRLGTDPSQDEVQHGCMRTPLKTMLSDRVPSLATPYQPSWWLPTGHFQTVYCAMGNFESVDFMEYRRTMLRVPDGGTLGLDFSVHLQDPGDSTPVIVVLHGLSGGSHESYIRSILATACASQDEGGLGLRAVVVNFRGCAGVPLTSPQFYSAGYTDDIRSALLYISARYPKADLLGLGFSLGASVMTRYVGEEGIKSRLKAACVLACPWNGVENSRQLESRFVNREIYSRAMGGNLIKLLKAHLETIEQFPDSVLGRKVAKALRLERPTLKDMDEHMFGICGGAGPPFPFPTAEDYYHWAGAHHALPGIRVPLLAINSLDDPIVSKLPSREFSQNPWTCLATTRYGGHLGWFEGGLFGREGRPPHRWVNKPVLEWFNAIIDIVDDLGSGPGPFAGHPREIRKGFVREVGRPFVGYRIITADQKIAVRRTDLLKGL